MCCHCRFGEQLAKTYDNTSSNEFKTFIKINLPPVIFNVIQNKLPKLIHSKDKLTNVIHGDAKISIGNTHHYVYGIVLIRLP